MTDTAADRAGSPSAPHPSVEQVVAALEAAGDRVVLRHPDGETTGADLLAAIHRYARALAGLGIGTGDLVAQYGPNRPDALAVRYATHLIDAAAVYVSAPPGADRRAQQLAQIDPRLVVVFPQTAHLLPETTAPVVAVGPVAGVRSASTSSPPRSRPRRSRRGRTWRTSARSSPPAARRASPRAACATSPPGPRRSPPRTAPSDVSSPRAPRPTSPRSSSPRP